MADVRVVISGASGLIGTALHDALVARGDAVVPLRRGVDWDPAARRLDPALLAGADAVVNLSGASIGRVPWTTAWRRTLRTSRIDATETIVAAIAALPAADRPRVLANASGITRPGGLLASIVREWEDAAARAPVPTVLLRTGIVVSPSGGAFAPLRALTRAGLGGRLGPGSQHWPWISLRDEVAGILHCLDRGLHGPVHFAGPTPATAAECLRALARRHRRPYWLPAPSWALRLALGEMADELLLVDAATVPRELLDSGFSFQDETIEAALRAPA